MIVQSSPGILTPFNSFNNPFRSFWMGGFECTDKINYYKQRVDFLKITGHLQLIDQDYRQLAPFNINTVREGIRWSQVETRPYHYDWSIVAMMIKKGKKYGIQQVWDICHFGFPDDLSPLDPKFPHRFASLCKAFAEFYRSVDPEGVLVVTPINEVSFLSWLGGSAGATVPFRKNKGREVKRGLMRAYIEGIAALKEADPTIRLLTTEPLINMVPPFNPTDEQVAGAARYHEAQYEATDILSGRLWPELGGKPEYLDIVGVNYYYNNQWVYEKSQFLPWKGELDPRWLPLRSLLTEVYERYEKPIALSETSHPGIDRPLWIKIIAEEIAAVIHQRLPLMGVCLYPIIDRPDWDHLSHWHASGLWDAELREGEPPARILYQPYADALLEAQAQIDKALKQVSLQVA